MAANDPRGASEPPVSSSAGRGKGIPVPMSFDDFLASTTGKGKGKGKASSAGVGAPATSAPSSAIDWLMSTAGGSGSWSTEDEASKGAKGSKSGMKGAPGKGAKGAAAAATAAPGAYGQHSSDDDDDEIVYAGGKKGVAKGGAQLKGAKGAMHMVQPFGVDAQAVRPAHPPAVPPTADASNILSDSQRGGFAGGLQKTQMQVRPLEPFAGRVNAVSSNVQGGGPLLRQPQPQPPSQPQQQQQRGGKGAKGAKGHSLSALEHELDAAAAQIIEEEVERGDCEVDMGFVYAKLKERKGTAVRCEWHRLPTLVKRERLVSRVSLLINVYKSTAMCGTLSDCIYYVLRQLNALSQEGDAFTGERFEDIGIGPWHRMAELRRHFCVADMESDAERRGVALSIPRVSAPDFIDAVHAIMANRQQRITETAIVEHIEAVKGRSRALLGIFEKMSLGLIIKLVSDHKRRQQDAIRSEVAIQDKKDLEKMRRTLLEKQGERLEDIDRDVMRVMDDASDLCDYVLEKLQDLGYGQSGDETQDEDIQKGVLMMLAGPSTKMQLAAALVCSSTLVLAAWGDESKCVECGESFDACAACMPRQAAAEDSAAAGSGSGSGSGSAGGVAPTSSSAAFTVEDVLHSIASVLPEAVHARPLRAADSLHGRAVGTAAAAAEAAAESAGPTVLSQLQEAERLACAQADVGDFASLGCGPSFVGFVARHAETLRDDEAYRTADPAVQAFLNALTRADAGGEAGRKKGRPTDAEVLAALLGFCESKSPFVSSWGMLSSAEEHVARKYGKERWTEVCAHPFTTFLARNDRAFRKRGFNLLGLADTVDAALVTSAATPHLPRTVAAAYIRARGGLEAGADVLDRRWASDFGTSAAGSGGVAGAQHGDAAEVLRAVGDAACVRLERTVAFAPAAEAAEAEAEARRAACRAAFGRAAACVDIIADAAAQPNGTDLSALLLWNELHRATQGPLGAFLVGHAVELAEAGVRVLAAPGDRAFEEAKYYLVARGADASAVEAAAEAGSHYEVGVLVWSLLCLQPLAELAAEGGSGQSALARVLAAVRGALAAARAAHTLPSAVVQVLLATPAPLAGLAFAEVFGPALDEVQAGWAAAAAGFVAAHPQRAEVLRKALRVPGLAEAWAPPYAAAAAQYPQHGNVVIAAPAAAVGAAVRAPAQEVVDAAAAAQQKRQRQEEEDEEGAWEGGSEQQAVLREIRERYSPGEDNPLTEITKRALGLLADQLYDSDFHFFFELVQNADDNEYPPETTPALRMHLSPDAVEILNNEMGFLKKNVEAVCNANASTKVGTASIGRKGIGFKAVFTVSDRPHITSNGYNFSFDRNGCDLGLILPVIEREEPVPSNGELVLHRDRAAPLAKGKWVTRLLLPFKEHQRGDKKFYEDCGNGMDSVQSLLLLFLNRLRRMEVDNALRGVRKVLERADAAYPGVPGGVGGEACLRSLTEEVAGQAQTTDTFLVYKQAVRAAGKDGQARETLLQAAFLVPAKAEEGLGLYPVMAYLPTNTRLFRFVLQADWTVTAARDRVVESDEWNRALRQRLVPALVEAFAVLRAAVDGGLLPVDYVYQAVPDRDLPVAEWFRCVVTGLHASLRQEPCVLALPADDEGVGRGVVAGAADADADVEEIRPRRAGASGWVPAPACVLLPADAGEAAAVLALLPPARFAALTGGRRYADAAAVSVHGRDHRAMLRGFLRVQEFGAPLLVEVLEAMDRAEAEAERVPRDCGWVCRCLALLKRMLLRVDDKEQADALLARVRAVRLVPIVSRGAAAGEAKGEAKEDEEVKEQECHLVALASVDVYAADANAPVHSFFRFLSIVDPRLFRCDVGGEVEAAARSFLLHRLGVRTTSPQQLIESMGGIVAGWRRSVAGVADGDLFSCVHWLAENHRALAGSSPEALDEVLAALPLVLAPASGGSERVLATLLEARGGAGDGEAVLRTAEESGDGCAVVRASCVQVAAAMGAEYRAALWAVGFCPPEAHAEYLRGCKKPHVQTAAMGLLERMGALRGVARAAFAAPCEATAEWVGRQEAALPACADGRYRVERDVRMPMLEAVLRALEAATDAAAKRAVSAALLYELSAAELDLGSLLATEVSYLPDFSAGGLEGRVAMEEDRTTGTAATTLLHTLRTARWMTGSDSGLHACGELFLYTEECRTLLRDQVVYAMPFGDEALPNLMRTCPFVQAQSHGGVAAAHAVLQRLGAAATVSDERLAEVVQGWIERGGVFPTSCDHMTGILRRVGGTRFGKIWVPVSRRPVEDGSDVVEGGFVDPAQCFVVGSTDAFLDWAEALPYRFVGFVYMGCGRELEAAGVQRFAPWEVQLECAEAVAARGDRHVRGYSRQGNRVAELVSNLLGTLAQYEDEITEAGWAALRTRAVWYAHGAEFVSLEKKKVLRNDRHWPLGDAVKLPKGYRILDYKHPLERETRFFERCGVERLSEHVVEAREHAETRMAARMKAVCDYLWAATVRSFETAVRDTGDVALLQRVVERHVFAAAPAREGGGGGGGARALRYVERFSVGYALKGGKSVAEKKEHEVFVDEAEGVVYLVAGQEAASATGMVRRFHAALRSLFPFAFDAAAGGATVDAAMRRVQRAAVELRFDGDGSESEDEEEESEEGGGGGGAEEARTDRLLLDAPLETVRGVLVRHHGTLVAAAEEVAAQGDDDGQQQQAADGEEEDAAAAAAAAALRAQPFAALPDPGLFRSEATPSWNAVRSRHSDVGSTRGHAYGWVACVLGLACADRAADRLDCGGGGAGAAASFAAACATELRHVAGVLRARVASTSEPPPQVEEGLVRGSFHGDTKLCAESVAAVAEEDPLDPERRLTLRLAAPASAADVEGAAAAVLREVARRVQATAAGSAAGARPGRLHALLWGAVEAQAAALQEACAAGCGGGAPPETAAEVLLQLNSTLREMGCDREAEVPRRYAEVYDAAEAARREKAAERRVHRERAEAIAAASSAAAADAAAAEEGKAGGESEAPRGPRRQFIDPANAAASFGRAHDGGGGGAAVAERREGDARLWTDLGAGLDGDDTGETAAGGGGGHGGGSGGDQWAALGGSGGLPQHPASHAEELSGGEAAVVAAAQQPSRAELPELQAVPSQREELYRQLRACQRSLRGGEGVDVRLRTADDDGGEGEKVIGRLGEQMVAEQLRAECGAGKVHWLNEETETFAPCDIVVNAPIELRQRLREPKGVSLLRILIAAAERWPQLLCVEVKTTAREEQVPMNVSAGEMQMAARLGENFALYQLTGIATDAPTVRMVCQQLHQSTHTHTHTHTHAHAHTHSSRTRSTTSATRRSTSLSLRTTKRGRHGRLQWRQITKTHRLPSSEAAGEERDG